MSATPARNMNQPQRVAPTERGGARASCLSDAVQPRQYVLSTTVARCLVYRPLGWRGPILSSPYLLAPQVPELTMSNLARRRDGPMSPRDGSGCFGSQ